MRSALLLILLAPRQDEPALDKALDKLVEAWKSEDPVVRNNADVEALQRWRHWREGDLARLRQIAKDGDAEVRGRATDALEAIRVYRRFGPVLVGAIPGIEAKLTGRDPKVHLDVLTRALELWEDRRIGEPELRVLAEYSGKIDWKDREGSSLIRLLGNADAPPLASIVVPMLRTLQNDPWREKEHILRILRISRLTESAEAVAALLTDERRSIREEALRTLVSLRAREQAPKIAPLLRTPESCTDAIRALEDLHAIEQSDEIAALLVEQAGPVRHFALTALGKLGAKEHAKKIASFLSDPDRNTRGNAVWALQTMGANEFTVEVSALLADAERTVREGAASYLSKAGAREYAPAIVSLIAQKDSWAYQGLLESIARLKSDAVVGSVVDLLRSEAASVRGNAVRALGFLGATDRAPAVASLLKDPNGGVRIDALETLGLFGAYATRKEVAGLLVDESEAVRATAIRSLGRMGAREYIPDIAWLLYDTQAVRYMAFSALGDLDARDALEKIRSYLDDSEEECRMAAAKTLGVLRSKQDTDVIVRLLQESDKNGRSAAIEALVSLEAADQVESILPYLKPGGRPEQVAAVEALGRLGSLPGAPVETIVKALQSRQLERSGLKRAASIALLRLGRADPGTDWTLVHETVLTKRRDWVWADRELQEALAWVHERAASGQLSREFELAQPVESVEDLKEAFRSRVGLPLVIPRNTRMWGRFSSGIRTTGARLLERLVDRRSLAVVPGGGALWIMDGDKALEYWHARLDPLK